MTVEKLNYK